MVEKIIRKIKKIEEKKSWSDEDYYNRAKLSYKLKNYSYALELLGNIKKKVDKVNRLYGRILFEKYDFEDAFLKIKKIRKKTVKDYVIMGLCLLFLSKPNAKYYIKKAYCKDKKKTKELLKDFYESFSRKFNAIDHEIEHLIERL